MKRYVLICFFSILLIAGLFFLRKNNEPLTAQHAEWGDNIKDNELAGEEARAAKGDCTSSLRLMRYHMNITLRYNDALKWGRVAAKCEQSESKELLLVLLHQRQNEVAIRAETDALLIELRRIDSKRAAELSEEIDNWRKQK